MSKQQYAIIRTKKISNYTKSSQVANHNLRTGYISSNIDQDRSNQNIILHNAFGALKGSQFTERLEEYYKSIEAKQKTNSTIGMEFVLTASPEFFQGKSRIEVLEWVNKQKEFIDQEWGSSVKLAICHLDEKTPHIHCVISTDHKTVKKYKNQFGSFEKETVSLNAKRFDRKYLIDLQTRYANFNSSYGLERGAFASRAKHKTLKEFYRMLEQSTKNDKSIYKQIKRKIDSIKIPLKDRFNEKAILEIITKELSPFLLNAEKSRSIFKKFTEFSYSNLQNRLKRERDDLEQKKKELEKKQKAFDQNHLKRLELEKQIKQRDQEIFDLSQENKLARELLEHRKQHIEKLTNLLTPQQRKASLTPFDSKLPGQRPSS